MPSSTAYQISSGAIEASGRSAVALWAFKVGGLRQQLRWYQAGLPVILLLLVGETVLLVLAYVALGRCG